MSPLTTVGQFGKKESKLQYLGPSWTSIGASALTQALGGPIASGTDTNTRLGRRIVVKRLGFAGQLLGAQTNSVADDPYNSVRLIIWRALPNFTPTSVSVNSFLDLRYQPGALEILYDKTFVLNVNAKDSVGYVACAKQVYINLALDVPLEFTGSGSSNPQNQMLFATAVSDSAAVVNPGFVTGSSFLLEFVDDV